MLRVPMSGINEKDATFRVMGDTLVPDAVTALLGITPDQAYAKGEPVPGHPERPYHTGYWGLSSQLPRTSPVEHMITDLLERVELRSDAIRSLAAEGWSLSFFCGVFAASEGGELVEFRADTLSRIRALGIHLVLDIYPVCEDYEQHPQHQ